MQTSKSDLDNADRVPVSAVAGDRGVETADKICGEFHAMMSRLSSASRAAQRPDIAQAIAYIHDQFIFTRSRLTGTAEPTPEQAARFAKYPNFQMLPYEAA